MWITVRYDLAIHGGSNFKAYDPQIRTATIYVCPTGNIMCTSDMKFGLS